MAFAILEFLGSGFRALTPDNQTPNIELDYRKMKINDQPIPPDHGAPLRLIIPFRYGARSLKAITEIQFTAMLFASPKPWPA